MRSRLAAASLVLLLALAGAGCSSSGARVEASPGVVPLDVEVRARAVAPGEPLRIVVYSPEPLVSLEGRFLDRPVGFVRSGGGHGAKEGWSGWTLVDLDRSPGPAVLEVRGRARSGAEAAATHAVSVEPKEFPEQRLRVEERYVTPPPDAQERIARERELLRTVYTAFRDVPPPPGPFVRPVPGEPTSAFGLRRFFNDQPRAPHSGLDLRAATGTPVLASGPGKVAFAGDLYFSGLCVILDHGGGLFTIYAHLSRIDVTEGDTVARADQVGHSGATGRVTGPHLHWGARVGDRIFDPTALLDPSLY
jgi:hypothetical protein